MLNEYSSEQKGAGPKAPPELPVSKQAKVIIKGKAPPASPSAASTVPANPWQSQTRRRRGPAARTPWPLPTLSTLGEPQTTGTWVRFRHRSIPGGPRAGIPWTLNECAIIQKGRSKLWGFWIAGGWGGVGIFHPSNLSAQMGGLGRPCGPGVARRGF